MLSISSSILPHFSGYVKKAWIDALMQRTPKMMKSFQDMFSNAGGINLDNFLPAGTWQIWHPN
jgi:hypothetical protein